MCVRTYSIITTLTHSIHTHAIHRIVNSYSHSKRVYITLNLGDYFHLIPTFSRTLYTMVHFHIAMHFMFCVILKIMEEKKNTYLYSPSPILFSVVSPRLQDIQRGSELYIKMDRSKPNERRKKYKRKRREKKNAHIKHIFE